MTAREEQLAAELAAHDERCIACREKIAGKRATRCLVGFRLYVEQLGARRKDGQAEPQPSLFDKRGGAA